MQQQRFAPFFAIKSADKGAGLGLSMSHQIITENHEGTLTCIFAIGQGIEFAMTIPIA